MDNYFKEVFAFVYYGSIVNNRPKIFIWLCLLSTAMIQCVYFRLIHIGQILNGLAGPIAMGAPPAISSEWFAPEQRTTATAIASLSNALGCAICFLLGELSVDRAL